MHPMSQLSTKFTDIPSLSKKKITKVSRLKSQWQRGSSSRCDQLICGWALPYKVKIPFEDINSISLRAVGTGWLWEAIAPLPYCVGNWPQRPILELLNILAGIQAKPSHSKGLGLKFRKNRNAFFQANVSSKKWTNKFYFTTLKPQVDLFSFIFLEKLKNPKSHFEINWPLVVAPPPTRIFKHPSGPAIVHSNGDDVYPKETNDFTESHLLY